MIWSESKHNTKRVATSGTFMFFLHEYYLNHRLIFVVVLTSPKGRWQEPSLIKWAWQWKEAHCQLVTFSFLRSDMYSKRAFCPSQLAHASRQAKITPPHSPFKCVGNYCRLFSGQALSWFHHGNTISELQFMQIYLFRLKKFNWLKSVSE